MIQHFGTRSDGTEVQSITIGAGEVTATILTLGAIVQDLRLEGVPYSLTIGAETIEAYEGPMKFCGALVGPVANRLAAASAPLGDRVLTFENDTSGPLLHGGATGMHQDIWDITQSSASSVTMVLELPDGRGGFPGNRTITAVFTVHAPATLTLEITASTDAATLINIANHSYWRLDDAADVDGHRLQVFADRYTPVDADLIPTGVDTVTGTAFDLIDGRELSKNGGQSYDHNFCLSGEEGTLKRACVLTGTSGVSLRMETTEIGLQVFDSTGNSTAPFTGHRGTVEGSFSAVALEAQRWPDAPNQKGFPSCVLDPSEPYRQTTKWHFGT